MQGEQGGSRRWNGGLMPAKYRRDYSARLDWRWANSISGLGPRTKEFSGLGAGVVYRATCSNHATGENDETASLPPSTSCPALVFKFPAARIPTDNRLRRIDDQWLECFLFFTFRGYLNFEIFSCFFFEAYYKILHCGNNVAAEWLINKLILSFFFVSVT